MSQPLRPRESVILAEDPAALVAWYRDTLGFALVDSHEKDYHYYNLQTPSGIRIGIADAKEMGVEPTDRNLNTVLLQFEVDDVQAFFAHLETAGGATLFGPNYDEEGFWFGGFSDPEGNPCWIVDKNCP